jgi:hypothetical protein
VLDHICLPQLWWGDILFLSCPSCPSVSATPLKLLGQMNRYLVGNIYGRSSINLLISSRSINKHGHHKQFLFLMVSEEKIKMWKVNGRRTPSNGKNSHCLWKGELKTWLPKQCFWVFGANSILSEITGMVVGFTTTCAISAYRQSSCEFKSCSWWGVFNTKLCDKVCQWLGTRYNWNIVESGIKHHKPKSKPINLLHWNMYKIKFQMNRVRNHNFSDVHWL